MAFGGCILGEEYSWSSDIRVYGTQVSASEQIPDHQLHSGPAEIQDGVNESQGSHGNLSGKPADENDRGFTWCWVGRVKFQLMINSTLGFCSNCQRAVIIVVEILVKSVNFANNINWHIFSIFEGKRCRRVKS